MIREVSMGKKTLETEINLVLNIDGTGEGIIDTGIGFFDHMLTLLAFHSNMNIDLKCVGDTYVDDHHTIEDTGILLGKAILRAMGDKIGITRYGTQFIPMDETLALANVDISGRGELVFNCEFKSPMVGNMSTQMVKEFFKAVANNSQMTIHINVPYGENDHHKVEAIFKAFARALKEALTITGDKLPSSKGVL